MDMLEEADNERKRQRENDEVEEPDYKRLHARAMVRMSELQEQIGNLAQFIMDNVPGEPSQSQGAVDTAIRVIRKLQEQNDGLHQAVLMGSRYQEQLEKVVEAAKRVHLLDSTCELTAALARLEQQQEEMEGWKGL